MKKKIIAFGATNSRSSINKQLATFAAGQVKDVDVEVLDLNDFEMPIYSIDREKESGMPQLAHDFKNLLAEADGIVISFAEHNGMYSVAFKNIFDWISRIDRGAWNGKPMFLLATSPGGRGGKSVLEVAVNQFSRINQNTLVHFSLPSFHGNFSEESGILHEELYEAFQKQLKVFEAAVRQEIPAVQ
ncbi:MAG: NADPH-dependent oxidoreductase [Bacteroidetes bacterium]|nr:MAG: NADPH-dependent oxidoreductase [Bacteroidota bacterium]